MPTEDNLQPKDASLALPSVGYLDDQLSFYIRLIEVAVSRDLDLSLKQMNFSGRKGTLTALVMIARHPGVRVSTIAETNQQDKSLSSKIIEELVESGLVEKRPDERDGRATGLYLTAHGLDMADRIEVLVTEQSKSFFLNIMTQEEHDIVIDILRRAFQKVRSKA